MTAELQKTKKDWGGLLFSGSLIVMSIGTAGALAIGAAVHSNQPTYESLHIGQSAENFKPGNVTLPKGHHYWHYYNQDLDVSFWLADDNRATMQAVAFPNPNGHKYAYCVFDEPRVAAAAGDFVFSFSRQLEGIERSGNVVVLTEDNGWRVATCALEVTKKDLGFPSSS